MQWREARSCNGAMNPRSSDPSTRRAHDWEFQGKPALGRLQQWQEQTRLTRRDSLPYLGSLNGFLWRPREPLINPFAASRRSEVGVHGTAVLAGQVVHIYGFGVTEVGKKFPGAWYALP